MPPCSVGAKYSIKHVLRSTQKNMIGDEENILTIGKKLNKLKETSFNKGV